MIKRKRLGQHFLTSNAIAKSIVSEAKIGKNDVVFEIGTGLGILTPLLCENAKKVISIDTDKELYEKAKGARSRFRNQRDAHGGRDAGAADHLHGDHAHVDQGPERGEGAHQERHRHAGGRQGGRNSCRGHS